MQSIENKVINRIYGNGRGWSFFKKDFIDLGSAAAIDQALSRLVKDGRIRRVIRGIYDYPKRSKLLDESLPPNIDKVAHTLARKFGWTIQASGNTALNLLGLSTQVPARYQYLSDGKNTSYQIGKTELSFKNAGLKDSGFKYPYSALVVQAIKALDKKKLNEEQRKKLQNQFTEKEIKRILKDTRYTTNWVYEEIKRIFKDAS